MGGGEWLEQMHRESMERRGPPSSVDTSKVPPLEEREPLGGSMTKPKAICGCPLNVAGDPCHGPRCHLFKGPEHGGRWMRITMMSHADGSHSMDVKDISTPEKVEPRPETWMRGSTPVLEEHEPLFTDAQWARIVAVARSQGEDPIAWVRGVVGLAVQDSESYGDERLAKPWDVTDPKTP